MFTQKRDFLNKILELKKENKLYDSLSFCQSENGLEKVDYMWGINKYGIKRIKQLVERTGQPVDFISDQSGEDTPAAIMEAFLDNVDEIYEMITDPSRNSISVLADNNRIIGMYCDLDGNIKTANKIKITFQKHKDAVLNVFFANIESVGMSSE